MTSEPTNQASIMVVDDTPANLRLLEDMLRDQKYNVRPLPNGMLALRAAKNDPPDLVLLDINMPGKNGFEVCQLFKEDDVLKDIPVIFISARTETFDKVKAFNMGGVDYITKPFQFEEVQARVETHLSLRKYQLELEAHNQKLQQTLTKLQKTQNQLIESKKMAALGVLTAGIAHEINNPINFIRASSKALHKILQPVIQALQRYQQGEMSGEPPDTTVYEQIKQEVNFDVLVQGLDELTGNIISGADRVADLIKGLKVFSHVDAHEKITTDVHDALELALKLLRNRYNKLITINKSYEEIPKIMGYPGKLNQVFMNIFNNAIDAIEQNAHPSVANTINVKTSLEQQEGQSFVAVEISDTGGGIPSTIKDRLFEPFLTTKDVGQGVGLGLSISLGIVENHGGFIEVQSVAGVGATFIIYLPVQS